MIAYCSLFFLLLLQGHLLSSMGRQYDKLFIILSFLEIMLIAGLRIPVDGDSKDYVEIYERISQRTFSEAFIFQFEEGYDLFCYFVSKISKNPQLLFFASTAFINYFVLRYIYNNCKIPWLGVVFYFSFMFFFNALNLMRFYMACALLLYANEYIIERKFLKSFFVVFIASSFHFTTIIYLLLYFVYPLKLSKKNIFVAIIIFIAISKMFNILFSLLIQFNPKYTSYADDNGEFYQSSFANILMCILQAFVFFFCIKVIKEPISRLQGYNKLATMSLFVALLMSIMAIDIMMFTRFLVMFSMIEIVYLPNLLHRYYRKPVYYLHSIIFLIITISQFFVILIFRPEWLAILPYRNYILENL